MAPASDFWLIYALGGGWGHLTRAVSLALAARLRHRVRILTNSPSAPQVIKALPDLDIAALDPSLPTSTAREQVIQHIRAARPDCLIVDTFPRGLGGELADVMDSLRATKVLVHRDLTPRYVSEANLRHFVRSGYHLILIPGQGEGAAFADLPRAAATESWLIRDPPSERCPGQQRRILISAGGPIGELTWYGEVAALLQTHNGRLDIRCVAPICPPKCPRESWVEHWPAADLYPAADVVIGGAGYNTIHECLAWRIPLIARPWPRKYDRQWLRARRAAQCGTVTVVKTPHQATEAAMRRLNETPEPERRNEIRNGTTEAVALIERATRN